MKAGLKEKVVELVEKPLLAEGSEIAEVVLSQYKSDTTLKLFLYSKNGMTLEECGRLSRLVGDILDGTDLFESGYTLEVSSPGLTRPLTTSQDFRYRVGEKVTVNFKEKGRKKVNAEIMAADDESVSFRDDSGEFKVALADIENAKIIF